MDEQKFAKNFIEELENIFEYNAKTSPFPTSYLDKDYYKKHNFDLLKIEFNKLGYELCEIKNAPKPYDKPLLRNKLFLYKIVK